MAVKNKFEVLWYTNEELSNYETKEFASKKAALAYYEKHKNDDGKYDWWVTERDEDWYVVDDLII